MARTKVGRRCPSLRLKPVPDLTKQIITKSERQRNKSYSLLMKQQPNMPKLKKLPKSHNFGAWSNLPEDLLKKIIDLVRLNDQFRATAVCKDWHSAITNFSHRPAPNSGSDVAWKFYYRWIKSDGHPKLNLVTELYDPPNGSSFLMENPNWNSKTNFAFGAKPVALKDGWFLFAKKFQGKSHFLFYHIFSKHRIWLPTLKHLFVAAMFSKNPLSSRSDCVTLASYRSGSKNFIATCRIGDKNWETMSVAGSAEDEDNYYQISSVVYGEEKNEFYCIFPGGILGKFSVSDHLWSLISEDGHGFAQRNHHHLFHYEGELLLVVKSLLIFRFYVFRFDWSTVKWIPMSNLDSITGASFMEFKSFFSKNRGNGSFLFLNLHYSTAQNKFWVDPPSLP